MKIGPSTTREERLAWDPAQAIAVARGPGPDESSTVATAMFDQLEAAGVPIDALDMSIMFWSRALDGLVPGPVPADRLARLDQDLALEMRTWPVLGRWLAALRGVAATAHDLDWIIRFCLQARQTWLLSQQLRRRQ